ncbi:MAG: hypothetical protein ABL916_15005 [Burkholderiaceae bacterium]
MQFDVFEFVPGNGPFQMERADARARHAHDRPAVESQACEHPQHGGENDEDQTWEECRWPVASPHQPFDQAQQHRHEDEHQHPLALLGRLEIDCLRPVVGRRCGVFHHCSLQRAAARRRLSSCC